MAKRLFLPFALTAGLAIAGFAGFAAYQWAKSRVAQDIYRDRLAGLQADYKALAGQYNQAVTPRPVTELLVEDGIVCLGVRNGEGELVRVPTNFNVREKKKRVYIDYLLVDQRLLIYVAFEFNQNEGAVPVPKEKVVYIDKDLLDIERRPDEIDISNSLSCSGLADGRYIITASGNGALDLEKIDADKQIQLVTHPKINDYPRVDEQANEDAQKIGFGDVWRYVFD